MAARRPAPGRTGPADTDMTPPSSPGPAAGRVRTHVDASTPGTAVARAYACTRRIRSGRHLATLGPRNCSMCDDHQVARAAWTGERDAHDRAHRCRRSHWAQVSRPDMEDLDEKDRSGAGRRSARIGARSARRGAGANAHGSGRRPGFATRRRDRGRTARCTSPRPGPAGPRTASSTSSSAHMCFGMTGGMSSVVDGTATRVVDGQISGCVGRYRRDDRDVRCRGRGRWDAVVHHRRARGWSRGAP